jgi:hypothetical protein
MISEMSRLSDNLWNSLEVRCDQIEKAYIYNAEDWIVDEAITCGILWKFVVMKLRKLTFIMQKTESLTANALKAFVNILQV